MDQSDCKFLKLTLLPDAATRTYTLLSNRVFSKRSMGGFRSMDTFVKKRHYNIDNATALNGGNLVIARLVGLSITS